MATKAEIFKNETERIVSYLLENEEDYDLLNDMMSNMILDRTWVNYYFKKFLDDGSGQGHL